MKEKTGISVTLLIIAIIGAFVLGAVVGALFATYVIAPQIAKAAAPAVDKTNVTPSNSN